MTATGHGLTTVPTPAKASDLCFNSTDIRVRLVIDEIENARR